MGWRKEQLVVEWRTIGESRWPGSRLLAGVDRAIVRHYHGDRDMVRIYTEYKDGTVAYELPWVAA